MGVSQLVTLQEILDVEPCYTRERIDELAGGRTSWTIREILDDSRIPAVDRIWLVCHLVARRDVSDIERFAWYFSDAVGGNAVRIAERVPARIAAADVAGSANVAHSAASLAAYTVAHAAARTPRSTTLAEDGKRYRAVRDAERERQLNWWREALA